MFACQVHHFIDFQISLLIVFADDIFVHCWNLHMPRETRWPFTLGTISLPSSSWLSLPSAGLLKVGPRHPVSHAVKWTSYGLLRPAWRIAQMTKPLNDSESLLFHPTDAMNRWWSQLIFIIGQPCSTTNQMMPNDCWFLHPQFWSVHHYHFSSTSGVTCRHGFLLLGRNLVRVEWLGFVAMRDTDESWHITLRLYSFPR